jgi:hypothetical protein
MMNILRSEVLKLTAQVEATSTPQATLESLSRENVAIRHAFRLEQTPEGQGIVNTWHTTVLEVFPSIARKLATVATEDDLADILRSKIKWTMYSGSADVVTVPVEVVQDLMIRLRTLLLVEKAPAGLPGQWTLTGIGEQVAMQIQKERPHLGL